MAQESYWFVKQANTDKGCTLGYESSKTTEIYTHITI